MSHTAHFSSSPLRTPCRMWIKFAIFRGAILWATSYLCSLARTTPVNTGTKAMGFERKQPVMFRILLGTMSSCFV